MSTDGGEIREVVVHPLVLLSVVDHYNRVAKDSKRRVVGVLLGESFKGRLDATNSFAIPFEEDPRDPAVWFLDSDYLEALFLMFKKVNARERILGFYSTGPRIRPADFAIEQLFRELCPTPVLVIVDVRPECQEIPTQAYYAVETVVEGKEVTRTFQHIASEIGAYEAEEVGVEHLLRDINDPSVSHLAGEIRRKLQGLIGLTDRLKQISQYLQNVIDDKVPHNHEILYNIQKMVSLLPNLGVETLVKALFVQSNDAHLVLYVSAMIRSVITLHDQVLNKIKLKDVEEQRDREEKSKSSAAATAKDGKPDAAASKGNTASDSKESKP